MAIKLFQGRAHEEYSKLFDLGYLEKQNDRILVKTQPQDMRKPLLEYLMQGASDGQPEMEEAFRRIGECLAVTWKETDYLLEPKVKSRVLFGRFVKKEKCFNLMCEGANRKHPVEHYAADSSLAYTPLMLQLSDDPVHTIAQFGQAVGAIYYSTAIA